MKQKPIMPKDHFDAIAAQLGSEGLKAVKRTEAVPKNETPKIMERWANYDYSTDILLENGLRLLTYQEALVHLRQNPKLKEKVEAKWFWLAGKSPRTQGFYTIDKKGSLTLGRSSPENTVYVYPGNHQLALAAYPNSDVMHFELHANFLPSYCAPVVVGIR